MRTIFTLATVFVLSLPVFAKPTPAVAVRVNPRVAHASAKQIVTAFVKIDPHEGNRYLTIGIASINRAESSTQQLEGANAPEALTKQWKSLPPGIYLLFVTVHRNDGKQLSAETSFCLAGPRVSCTDSE